MGQDGRMLGEGGAERACPQEQCLPTHLPSASWKLQFNLSISASHHVMLGKPVRLSEPRFPHLPSGDKTLTPPALGAAERIIPGRYVTANDDREIWLPKPTPPTCLSRSLSHRLFWAHSPPGLCRLQHHLTTSWVTHRPLPG